MNEAQIHLVGVEKVMAALATHCRNIGYLTLIDRTHGANLQLGRMNFDSAALRTWLQELLEDGPDPDDLELEDCDSAEDDDDSPDETDGGNLGQPKTSLIQGFERNQTQEARLARAAFRWVESTARELLAKGEAERKLRVRLYSPKGLAVLGTASFSGFRKGPARDELPAQPAGANLPVWVAGAPTQGQNPPPGFPLEATFSTGLPPGSTFFVPGQGGMTLINTARPESAEHSAGKRETGQALGQASTPSSPYICMPSPPANPGLAPAMAGAPVPAPGAVVLTQPAMPAQAWAPNGYPRQPYAEVSPTLQSAQDLALSGVTMAYHNLGQVYSEFSHLVLGTSKHFTEVLAQANQGLGDQLRESRMQTSDLLTLVVEGRDKDSSQQRSDRLEQAMQERRLSVAQGAIERLGQVAQAFFMSKGVPPDLAEMLGLLNGSPELMAALQDPAVKSMLRQPSTLPVLAEVLKDAASTIQGLGGEASGPVGAMRAQATQAGGPAPAPKARVILHRPAAGGQVPPEYAQQNPMWGQPFPPQGYAQAPGPSVPHASPPGHAPAPVSAFPQAAPQPYPAATPQAYAPTFGPSLPHAAPQGFQTAPVSAFPQAPPQPGLQPPPQVYSSHPVQPGMPAQPPPAQPPGPTLAAHASRQPPSPTGVGPQGQS